jgi:D-alanyl-D-alanine dipeptidase
MPDTNQESVQVAEALNRLSIAMEDLQTRYDASQRASRRIRIALMIVLLLLGGAAYQLFSPVIETFGAVAQSISQVLSRFKPQPKNTAAAIKKKQQLLMQLTDDERARIEHFQKQEKWVAQYLAVNPNYHPGAAVALHLSQMSDAVMVMPKMYDEIQAMNNNIHIITRELNIMNDKMNAMPPLAGDIREMKFYISIMARDVNSSMGKAGRILPW